eukprot:TRINITY_DN4883_c0_g2_i1.p4 TRINITY_DN4883_c0_g2~~TRINITY_DN4883_c0_g2_i1.p4  ORF type:complete len:104 (+),score=30.86 TRINITY_DN4883_c0_g2_i1:492-803(+)
MGYGLKYFTKALNTLIPNQPYLFQTLPDYYKTFKNQLNLIQQKKGKGSLSNVIKLPTPVLDWEVVKNVAEVAGVPDDKIVETLSHFSLIGSIVYCSGIDSILE